MLLKFIGLQGPLIDPLLSKAVQAGEVFECPASLQGHYERVAPDKFAAPTEEEVEAYRAAKAKAKADGTDKTPEAPRPAWATAAQNKANEKAKAAQAHAKGKAATAITDEGK